MDETTKQVVLNVCIEIGCEKTYIDNKNGEKFFLIASQANSATISCHPNPNKNIDSKKPLLNESNITEQKKSPSPSPKVIPLNKKSDVKVQHKLSLFANKHTAILEKPLLKVSIAGEEISFKKQTNSGYNQLHTVSGSCGYIALGAERKDVLATLLSNLDHPIVKESIAGQIKNDDATGASNLLNKDHTKELERIKNAYHQFEKAYADIISKHKNIIYRDNSSENLDSIGLNDLINHYQGKLIGQSEDLAGLNEAIVELTSAQVNRQKSEDDMITFLQSRDVIEDYLQRTIPLEWIGTRVMKAWAAASNCTLRIWGVNSTPSTTENVNPDDLYFQERESFEAKNSSTTPIDIIHSGSHYERLVIMPAAPNGWNTIGAATIAKISQYLPERAARDFSLTCRLFYYPATPTLAQSKPKMLETLANHVVVKPNDDKLAELMQPEPQSKRGRGCVIC